MKPGKTTISSILLTVYHVNHEGWLDYSSLKIHLFKLGGRTSHQLPWGVLPDWAGEGDEEDWGYAHQTRQSWGRNRTSYTRSGATSCITSS